MAQRKSALKRIRSDKKRRQHNLAIKRKIKEVTKKYLKTIEDKNLEEAKNVLKSVYKVLDKASFKKYIHRNKASRQKAQMAKKLKTLQKP